MRKPVGRPRGAVGIDHQRLLLQRLQVHRRRQTRRGGRLRGPGRVDPFRSGGAPGERRVAGADVGGELVERGGRFVGDPGKQRGGDAGRAPVELQRGDAALGGGGARVEVGHLVRAGAQRRRLFPVAGHPLVEPFQPLAQLGGAAAQPLFVVGRVRTGRPRRSIQPPRRSIRRARRRGVRRFLQPGAERLAQGVQVAQPALARRRGKLLLHGAPARLLGLSAAELQQQLLPGLRPVPLQEAAQLAFGPLVPFAAPAQPLGGAVDLLLHGGDPGGPMPDQRGHRHGAAGGGHADGGRRQHRQAHDRQQRGQRAPGEQAQSDFRGGNGHPGPFRERRASRRAVVRVG